MFLASSRSLAGEAELALLHKSFKIMDRHLCVPACRMFQHPDSKVLEPLMPQHPILPVWAVGREERHPSPSTLRWVKNQSPLLFQNIEEELFNHLQDKTDAGICQGVCVCVLIVQWLENGASILPSSALELCGGWMQSFLFPDLFNIHYFSVVRI